MKIPFFRYSHILAAQMNEILSAATFFMEKGAFIMQEELKNFESAVANLGGSRHAITGFFAVGVLGGIVLGPIFPKAIGVPFFGVMALYVTLAVLSSIQQAVRYKEIRHIFFLPFAFFLYHFIHGLGLLKGLLRLATFTAPVQKINEPWPGAGFYRVPIRRGCLSKDRADKIMDHS